MAAGALMVAVMTLANQLPATLEQPQSIFAAVFSQLPAEVEVKPTEHYFYWRGHSAGKEGIEVRGNLRFANGLREKGILSLGYMSKEGHETALLSEQNGVEMQCPDLFTTTVRFQGKTVIFHLNRLPQKLPDGFKLSSDDEQFVERTSDESGLQFLLLYHKARNHFLWALDESVKTGNFVSIGQGMELETESGFVFWQATEGRKILAAVSKSNIDENNYFDGPFDQLADNHAATSDRKRLMEIAIPECAGKIDAFGNYLNSPKPRRVGLVPYWQYSSLDDAKNFVSRALQSEDPAEFIAKLGQVKSASR